MSDGRFIKNIYKTQIKYMKVPGEYATLNPFCLFSYRNNYGCVGSGSRFLPPYCH